MVFERLVLQSWWVLFFVLLCLIGYERELKTIRVEYERLNTLHQQLFETKQQVLAHRQGLRHRINSQSEPRWIELALMKGLGLVPEGQTKIYFEEGVEKPLKPIWKSL